VVTRLDGLARSTRDLLNTLDESPGALGERVPPCAAGANIPEIVATFHQDIEGTELDLMVVQTGVECIEVRDAVDAEDHRLTVEHKTLLADFAGGLDDPRVPAG
jgi:hypothetical protein